MSHRQSPKEKHGGRKPKEGSAAEERGESGEYEAKEDRPMKGEYHAKRKAAHHGRKGKK